MPFEKQRGSRKEPQASLISPGENPRHHGMEAAGIEPASRDSSMGASTCVSGLFEFNLSKPEPGGGLHQAVRKQNLIFRVFGVTKDDPKLTSD